MDEFCQGNKIFLAIIIGAVIIGGCLYSAVRENNITANKTIVPAIVKSYALTPVKANPVVEKSNTAVCGASAQTIVTKVIDGDTVVVEGGYHVRLLGMDADEKGYPCYDQAKIGLESLVLGKQVILEKDKTNLDQYGRCLRYIFIGGMNVDLQLVKEGLAVARFYEPDIRYKDEIASAEKSAQVAGTGCKWFATGK